jgi:tetratricopeptide (TPR) repeat protein
MRPPTVAVCSLAALAALDLSPKPSAPDSPAAASQPPGWDWLLLENSAQAAEVDDIAPPESLPIASLSDIQQHWAQPAIEELRSEGLVRGFADGTFRPDEPIAPEHLRALVQQATAKHGIGFLISYAKGLPSPQQTVLLQALGQAQPAPASPVTRAAAIALIHQALVKSKRVPVMAAPPRPATRLAAIASASPPSPAAVPAVNATGAPVTGATAADAQCQTGTRSVSDRIAACDRLLVTQPQSAPTWALRGNLLAKTGKFAEAVTSYDRALALTPADPVLWTQKGVVLSKLGQHTAAIVAHDKALEQSSKYSLALTNRCATLNKLGKYAEALEQCDRALSGDGRWSEAGIAYAWDQRGVALAGLGRLEEAIAAVDQAVALSPKYVEAWSNRAVTLWRMKQEGAALESVDRALALKPDYSQGWFNKGRILRSLDRPSEAVTAYDRALQSEVVGDKPTLADIWANRSAALWLLDNYPAALESTQRAVQIDPNSALGWFNQGGVLLALKQPQAAAAAYDRALQLDPKYSYAWTGKGIALQQLGQYPAALTALDRALEINPQQALAQQGRQEVQQRLQASAH